MAGLCHRKESKILLFDESHCIGLEVSDAKFLSPVADSFEYFKHFLVKEIVIERKERAKKEPLFPSRLNLCNRKAGRNKKTFRMNLRSFFFLYFCHSWLQRKRKWNINILETAAPNWHWNQGVFWHRIASSVNKFLS